MKEPQQKKSSWALRGGLLAGVALLITVGVLIFSGEKQDAPAQAIAPLAPAPTEKKPEVPVARSAPPPNTPSAKPAEAPSTRSPEAIAWLERLGAENPTQAISWALTEGDPQRRAELVQAALRGWASVDGEAAAHWARNQSYAEQGLAMSAVFNGANKSPDKAIQLAQRLVKEDPAHSADYGSYLVFSLGTVGEFSRAAAYAAESPADQQTQLLTSAYNRWAQHEPEPAAKAALRLTDPAMQRAAFQAAIGGWAQADPEQLTKAALTFPEGEDRKLALTTGLRSWIEKNPAAAEDWISHNKYMPEMDAALED